MTRHPHKHRWPRSLKEAHEFTAELVGRLRVKTGVRWIAWWTFWDDGDVGVRVAHNDEQEKAHRFSAKGRNRQVCVRKVIAQAEEWLEQQPPR